MNIQKRTTNYYPKQGVALDRHCPAVPGVIPINLATLRESQTVNPVSWLEQQSYFSVSLLPIPVSPRKSTAPHRFPILITRLACFASKASIWPK